MGRRKVKICKLEELDEGEQFQLATSWHEGQVLTKTPSRVKVKYTHYKFINSNLEEQIIPSYTIDISPQTEVIKVKK
jgi:hypothetical protein